ncbi:MAG: 4Fe-4S double cluster binding domain-containing protein [Candidatus Zixiibacteriota bacterium]
MNNSDKRLKIKKELINRGASLVGFADLNQLPADIRDSQRFALSIAVALDPDIIAGIREGPTQKYHLEYKRANALLSDLADDAAGMIRDWGHRAIPKAPTNVGIDPKTHSTILPHKTVATRAGLGWIGKCALLITREYGAAIRLTTVLTDAELETETPMDQSLCGDCEACVELCPGGAPSGENWSVNLHRDSFFDAFACARAARECSKSRMGINDTICGICISVCPWTTKYIKRESQT